jgi:hypothetical protein
MAPKALPTPLMPFSLICLNASTTPCTLPIVSPTLPPMAAQNVGDKKDTNPIRNVWTCCESRAHNTVANGASNASHAVQRHAALESAESADNARHLAQRLAHFAADSAAERVGNIGGGLQAQATFEAHNRSGNAAKAWTFSPTLPPMTAPTAAAAPVTPARPPFFRPLKASSARCTLPKVSPMLPPKAPAMAPRTPLLGSAGGSGAGASEGGA